MIRRFVNLVVEEYKTGMYSLHRLDASKHLFHQSRADARVVPSILAPGAQPGHTPVAAAGDEQPIMLDRLNELPPPCVKIHTSFDEERGLSKLPFWGVLSPRRSENEFLCMNGKGDAMLCSAGKPSVDPMPHLREEVGLDPISFSVVRPDEEEDLYVIHDVPERGRVCGGNACFSVFRKDADGWRWESLPPPPFVNDPRYNPAFFMHSYTVVDGGRTICFSCAAPGIGTYCFNTVEREWSHAGNWLLPFEGGAEYVPDLGLWLGFSPCSPSYYLCGTSDLNAAMSMDNPPKLQYVWQDLVTPKNWSAEMLQVVSLGSGRFCIVKAFEVGNRYTGGESDDEWLELEDEVTVLTGIEVGRDDDERLKVWKHMSLEYCSSFCVKGVL